jgi:MFS family permease
MTGIAMTAMVFFGQAAFTASFFQRVHGPQLLVLGQEFGLGPQGFVGATMGLAFGVGGLLGNLMGGPLGDRAARRNAGGYLMPPAIAALTLAPLGFACYIAPDVISSLLFLACGTTAGMMFYGPSFAALHSIVRPELRSSASALALMTLNLVGYGFGPLAVGIMTDVLADPMAMGQAEGLRWSLIGISVFGGPIAAFSFYRASRLMTVEQTQLGSVSS